MEKVIACIDGAARTTSVCDYAAWAAQCLGAPLQFLHVLDRHPERAAVSDYSGAIGFDAQEHLLEELASLDEKRSKLAQQHGKHILQAARERASLAGVQVIDTLQRHGSLVGTLLELEPDIRLVVIGQHVAQGDQRASSFWHMDHHVERAVRSLHRPILVAVGEFRPLKHFTIAFDGSSTGRKMINTVAASPLLAGLECDVVIASEETSDVRDGADWAKGVLQDAGFSVNVHIQTGEPEKVLTTHLSAHSSDVLIMGAYGHSRIRSLIVGSTTTTMLRTSPVPVLILR